MGDGHAPMTQALLLGNLTGFPPVQMHQRFAAWDVNDLDVLPANFSDACAQDLGDRFFGGKNSAQTFKIASCLFLFGGCENPFDEAFANGGGVYICQAVGADEVNPGFNHSFLPAEAKINLSRSQ